MDFQFYFEKEGVLIDMESKSNALYALCNSKISQIRREILMKQRRMLRRVMSAFLCVMMVIMMQSTAAFAAIDNYNKDYQSETHTVFKHTEQTLAPGVTNYTN